MRHVHCASDKKLKKINIYGCELRVGASGSVINEISVAPANTYEHYYSRMHRCTDASVRRGDCDSFSAAPLGYCAIVFFCAVVVTDSVGGAFVFGKCKSTIEYYYASAVCVWATNERLVGVRRGKNEHITQMRSHTDSLERSISAKSRIRLDCSIRNKSLK